MSFYWLPHYYYDWSENNLPSIQISKTTSDEIRIKLNKNCLISALFWYRLSFFNVSPYIKNVIGLELWKPESLELEYLLRAKTRSWVIWLSGFVYSSSSLGYSSPAWVLGLDSNSSQAQVFGLNSRVSNKLNICFYIVFTVRKSLDTFCGILNNYITYSTVR